MARVAWNKGIPMKSGTKLKISASKKGKNTGSNNHMFGKKMSQKTKERLRQAHKESYLKDPMLKSKVSRKGSIQSVETRIKISKKQKGDKHYNWQGGISKLAVRIRNSVEYRLWREAVFERDNYTCQDCGARGIFLHAHHVKAFASFPELRFAIDNGLTLCVGCHEKTDNYKKRNDLCNNSDN